MWFGLLITTHLSIFVLQIQRDNIHRLTIFFILLLGLLDKNNSIITEELKARIKLFVMSSTIEMNRSKLVPKIR